MKKLIYALGIMFLGIIIVLNFIFTAELSINDNIEIYSNSFVYVIGIILIGIMLFIGTEKLNNYVKERKKMKKILLIGAISIYIVFNFIWALFINPKVVGDSVHVCNLAQTFYRGDSERFLNNNTYAGITLKEYMQVYPQQISLAFVFSNIFRVLYFDIMELLRGINIISNIGIVIAVYKIGNLIAKEYKVNKVLLFTLTLTFISIPMLLTYIYGDLPSLALCLFAVYFIMKYTEEKETKYFVLTTILTMLAYMMRMNSLIFIIAIVIYLILYFIKEFKENTKKQKIINLAMIVIYLSVAILPTKMIQNYYFNKYNLDENKIYPKISYFLMAMEESPRGNGWYNEEIAEKAIRNPENIKQEYSEKIRERLEYFYRNPSYLFQFYTMKITSMWTENTYSAVKDNAVKNINIEKFTAPLTFYQKTLLIITCSCTLIFLIQNRKNISIHILLLLTIFVGGFAFHILWEAKSRYIIPYIVVLIPIASININKLKIKR